MAWMIDFAFVFFLTFVTISQGFNNGDAPRRNDASRFLSGGDAPYIPRESFYRTLPKVGDAPNSLWSGSQKDLLKARLLRDYRQKLLQQDAADDEEIYEKFASKRSQPLFFRRRVGKDQQIQKKDVSGGRRGGGKRGDQHQLNQGRRSDEQKHEGIQTQQESLDNTKEELKRSLLKDFYKKLMAEKKDQQQQKDAKEKNFDDEIIQHLVEYKLQKEDSS